MYRRFRAWLEAALATPSDRSTVVVTHHAPSRRRIAAAPLRTGLETCYASALDNLVASSGAALWVHGHTLDRCADTIGATRVVDNGRGYGGENVGSYDPAHVVGVAP